MQTFLRQKHLALLLSACVLLVIAFLFGGASRQHALRLALVELTALPLLILAFNRLWATGALKEHRFALLTLVGVLAVPLIQLIPLPPAVWSGLPGREQAVLALSLAGMEPGWVPLSLTPDLTWRAFLALLPAAAMFLGMLVLSDQHRLWLTWLLLALAGMSFALGVAQLVSGGEELYPWATTSAGSVSGFFANRNHLASLLVAMVPLVLLLTASEMRRAPHRNQLMLTVAALSLGLIVVAAAVIRSRAGVVLLGPVLVLSFLAMRAELGRRTFTPAILSIAGVIIVALVLVAALGLGPILARFDTGGAPEGRFEKWPLVFSTAQAYLPVGAGLGSFDTIYRSVEPLHELDSTFFNQAHNDYLEIWLEAGWLGIGLVIAFAIWFARRLGSAWKRLPSRAAALKVGAGIAVLVVLAHSGGDYPLRTETWLVVFAMLAGILEAKARPAR